MQIKDNIVILGDSHFGGRNDSELFMAFFFTFYEEVFFKFLEENNIKHVIQTGDFMDKRKNINYRTLNAVYQRFMFRLQAMGITLHLIPGNHDIFHRNSNEINSITELFGWMDNVIIYNEPTSTVIEGLNIDFIPWINKYNLEDTLKFIDRSNSQYCVGHFEIDGFDMSVGIPGHGGLNEETFAGYDLVISGHYHTRSKRRNIQYVGTPYEITWNDFNDTKGFHSLSAKGELTFYPNEYRMFHKAFYSSDIDYSEFDFNELSGGIVKVIVQDHRDIEKYEDFITRIEEAKPNDFSVVESDVIVIHGVDAEEMENLDTFSVLRNAATQVAKDEGLNVKKMLKFIDELYSEAVILGRDQI